MTPAVDNIGLLLNELPPPSVLPARVARSSESSFQDHLARAGGAAEMRGRSGKVDERKSAEADTAAPSAKSRRDDAQAEPAAKRPQESPVVAGEAVAKEKSTADDGANEAAEEAAAKTPSDVADDTGNQDSEEGTERRPEDAVSAALAALVPVAAKPESDEVTISDDAGAAEEPALEAVDPAKGEKPRQQKAALADQSVVESTSAANEQTAEQPKVLEADATAEATPEPKTSPVEPDARVAAEQSRTVAQAARPVEKKPAESKHGRNRSDEVVAANGEIAKPAESTVESVVATDSQAGAAEQRDRRASRDGRPTTVDESGTASQAAAAPTTAGLTPENVAAAAQANAAGAATDVTVKEQDSNGTQGSVEGAHDAKSRSTPQFVEAQRAANGGQASGRTRVAGETNGDGELPQADRVRLVQRVAKAVQSAVERGGDLQIRLSPPELGSLRLQVKLADGVLSAKLEAETPQAKQILTDNLPQLRERLAQQDIRVEKFDVDLFSSGGGGGPSYLPDRRQDAPQDSTPQGSRAGGVRRGNGSEGAASSTATTRAAGDGRLDIVV